MTFGRSQVNFYNNTPEAVAQVISTRLGLFVGEWFLDTTAGTPWGTKILGKYTERTRNLAIQGRILGTPGVQEITAYSSAFDPDTRRFVVSCTVSTVYGTTSFTAPVGLFG
jgi:hypothetical protein